MLINRENLGIQKNLLVWLSNNIKPIKTEKSVINKRNHNMRSWSKIEAIDLLTEKIVNCKSQHKVHIPVWKQYLDIVKDAR